LFHAYHEGFRAQAQRWEVKPVDMAISWIRSKKKVRVVADFGCGDAQIAQELSATHVVHSFDLIASNRCVTACNMADVPLKSGVPACTSAECMLVLGSVEGSKK
jgi:ribosomal RNA-processing protein 8